ncbi:uracil-DNA glycosylase [Marinicella gelatinilytica]|uniref:uracil-DNA glycosylase n=1 Tax=Marinicella gelatinilytica TaxID=2996017 RepID=UPI002260F32F|nr:uracil-DNA glycosylase [Marinicella gelatinilytica]MCX7545180.1 uracil-DNA glycosylase [Marinicella gelatinilytica]
MAENVSPKLESSWLKVLADEFQQDYMQALKQFLLQEKQHGQVIYPPGSHIFAAFDSTPLTQVKVVILGQDPYHGPNQAHGLSFSVQAGTALPPSLKNIYKELQSDLGVVNGSGDLSAWAEQGVLLLNSVLTVRKNQAASHRNQGWEQFTDAVIRIINNQCQHVVFMLWGSYAQKKGQVIDTDKHLVLTAPHPSPLSAHRGFFGCHHFSQANTYLKTHHGSEIDWELP